MASQPCDPQRVPQTMSAAVVGKFVALGRRGLSGSDAHPGSEKSSNQESPLRKADRDPRPCPEKPQGKLREMVGSIEVKLP